MGRDTHQVQTWAGQFGKEYTDRNALTLEEMENSYIEKYGISRTELNNRFINDIDRSSRILEVGSNIGNQLLCLQKMGFKDLYGIELQSYAVEFSKSRTKGINITENSGFDIPYKDDYFDLVFTSGVLIHIAPSDISRIMTEVHRCTKKYIWGFEYYAEDYTEISYRGKKNLLWKADFPKLYLDQFSDLELVKKDFLDYLQDENTDVMFLLKKSD
jgi:pseudaminic acid biosynthesis-associated methylase